MSEIVDTTGRGSLFCTDLLTWTANHSDFSNRWATVDSTCWIDQKASEKQPSTATGAADAHWHHRPRLSGPVKHFELSIRLQKRINAVHLPFVYRSFKSVGQQREARSFSTPCHNLSAVFQNVCVWDGWTKRKELWKNVRSSLSAEFSFLNWWKDVQCCMLTRLSLSLRTAWWIVWMEPCDVCVCVCVYVQMCVDGLKRDTLDFRCPLHAVAMGTCVIANLCCSKTKIIITSWVWEASESLPSYARHTWDRLKVSSRRWNVSRHKTSNRKARVHYCITPPRVYDVSHKWKRFPLSSRRDWRVIGRQTRLDEAFFFFFLFLPPGWNCNLKSGRCAALRCRASKSWNIKCQNVFLLKYLTASRTTGSCWYKQNNRCCSINRSMKGGKKTVCTLWPTLILFIISQHWELHNWSTTHTQICWFYVYILIIRPTVKEPWLSLSFKSPESRSQILCNHMTPVEEFYLLWWCFVILAGHPASFMFLPGTVWSSQSWIKVITFTEEVMFSTMSVVGWFVSNVTQTLLNRFSQNLDGGWSWPRMDPINLWCRSK